MLPPKILGRQWCGFGIIFAKNEKIFCVSCFFEKIFSLLLNNLTINRQKTPSCTKNRLTLFPHQPKHSPVYNVTAP
ncbi:hypothetical protein C7N43_12745 [Sphingobacteriales bacterium UPWRP_1]|nr:hypothetical protein B6N25_03715 [Sphingobacteriales bacterium TSM_CSS]PSJ76631.1 hypothetical protein C7N43_12745 [Sphingobacteriales bacterium UPWRP_1]